MDASTPVYSGRRIPVAEAGWAPTARRRTALGWALLLLALALVTYGEHMGLAGAWSPAVDERAQQVRPSAGTLSAAGQGPARRTLSLGISTGTAPPAHRPLMMSSTGVGVPPAQPTPTAQP
jgi:hypothetical protein